MELKSYVSISDQGPHLQVNEDKVDVNLRDKLYMILDGFGGSGIGDVAVEKIRENINTFYTKIADDPESTLPFYYNKKFLIEGNAIVNAIHMAHKNLVKDNIGRKMDLRAGASGIFIAESDTVLTILAVGNCKAYLLRSSQLTPLVLADSYELLSGKARTQNTFPLSGFGLFDDITYTVQEFRPAAEDILIFLTEGCYAPLGEEELGEILTRHVLDLNLAGKALLDLANEKGNLKNQSILLLRY